VYFGEDVQSVEPVTLLTMSQLWVITAMGRLSPKVWCSQISAQHFETRVETRVELRHSPDTAVTARLQCCSQTCWHWWLAGIAVWLQPYCGPCSGSVAAFCSTGTAESYTFHVVALPMSVLFLHLQASCASASTAWPHTLLAASKKVS